MNNKELQSAIAAKMDIPVAEVENLLQSTVGVLIEQLQANKTVHFQGFGSFEVRKKEERLTVNPMTQKRTITPPKLVLNFKVGTVFRDKIKELPNV